MKDQNYPVQYIIPVQLPEGTMVQLRPIHPSDGQYAESFKATLSKESLNSRFFGQSPKITESIVKKYVDIDFQTEMAIVAEAINDYSKEVIGIGRIAPHSSADNSAEFGIIISDQWQGKNLGNILTSYLIHVAKEMGYDHLYAYTYNDNSRMIEILKTENFQMMNEDYQTLLAKLSLDTINQK